MDLSQVKCDLPYPEVNVAKDLSEARLILPNYAGRDSETTAILTYVYQSYMTADLKKILEEISIVEMTHHEMLGEAIVKLGGYPIIGSGCFWNGSFINYTSNPKVYLKNNIDGEKLAIKNYEKTILALNQRDLKLLLERIILDEEVHIKIFEELLLKYDET